MRTRAPLVTLIFLLAACGDDGTSGSLHQDGTITSPDGLTSDSAADVSDDTWQAADDTVSTGADTHAADTHAADTLAVDTGPTGPTLTIRVEGDLDDRSTADGLAGQTPSVWRYGLQRLELLRSADDPAPEVIFDYAPDFVLVDLLADNIVARVPIADLPAGTFPYFRIVLTHAEVRVAATLHQVPVLGDYPTALDIVYALSDVQSGDLDMAQGDVTVKANIYGTDYLVPTHWPVVAPSPAPSAWAAAVDGEWRVTFAVSPALTPSPLATSDVTYAIRFYVANAFRWRDQVAPGYATDVWDLAVGPPPSYEPVERFGANAYEVYYQGQ